MWALGDVGRVGVGENCVMRDCRLGLDVVNGVYASGFLSSCAGFLLTCRDMYVLPSSPLPSQAPF